MFKNVVTCMMWRNVIYLIVDHLRYLRSWTLVSLYLTEDTTDFMFNNVVTCMMWRNFSTDNWHLWYLWFGLLVSLSLPRVRASLQQRSRTVRRIEVKDFGFHMVVPPWLYTSLYHYIRLWLHVSECCDLYDVKKCFLVDNWLPQIPMIWDTCITMFDITNHFKDLIWYLWVVFSEYTLYRIF